MRDRYIRKIVDDYNERYQKFGYSPKALGWGSGKQNIRFSTLMDSFDVTDKSLLDVGCGFGDLDTFLKDKGEEYKYFGIDVVDSLLIKAKELHPDRTFICCDFLDLNENNKYDFIVASGIFNRRISHDDEDNYKNIKECMRKAYTLCTEGFAFDFLSDKVDYKDEGLLFYNSPERVLNMAYNYSRNVVLKNDYMPFEFCIKVLKDDSFSKEDKVFNYIKKGK